MGSSLYICTAAAILPLFIGNSHMPSVSLRVPSVLRAYTGGKGELLLEANSVRSAFGWIERKCAPLYPNICDDTGRLRPHLNLFVNGSHMRRDDVRDVELADGDVVTILTAVSGG